MMKFWSVTTNMSQELTGFNVLSAFEVSRYVNLKRREHLESIKIGSRNPVIEQKSLFPVDSWLIDMAFAEFEEKYMDIDNVELIDIKIKLVKR